MTPTERGIALALESVRSVARISALDAGPSTPDEDRYHFLVELRPSSARVMVEAHQAIVRSVGRAAAAVVTYGDVDHPSPTLQRRAREIRLTPAERHRAVDEAALRVLPTEEEWVPALVRLTILIIENDVKTERAVSRLAHGHDVIVSVPFGLQARALARERVFGSFDLVFAGVSPFRGPQFTGQAPLDGLTFFEEAVAFDPSIANSIVLVKQIPPTPLDAHAGRRAAAVLTKPLLDWAVLEQLDRARARLLARETTTFNAARANATAAIDRVQYLEIVTALRSKGGAACEQLADVLAKAVDDPDAYLAGLRAKAAAEGPSSVRAVPRTSKEILDLLRDTAQSLLSV